MINTEKNIFLKKATGWMKDVSNNSKSVLTPFLTLKEQNTLSKLAITYNVEITFFGGYENSERNRAFLCTRDNKYEVKNSFFKMEILKINYRKKFLNLEHKHVLGNLLNNGINKNHLGDIVFTEDNNIYICVTQSIANYILSEVRTFNNVPISFDIVEKIEETLKENAKEMRILTSSMRLDTLVSSLIKESRNKVTDIINQNLVTVNWETMNKHSHICKIGDVISIRKKGRFIVEKYIGESKKGKLLIEIKYF